ncbi:pentapeptide repeat-containing protein [Corynebacterium mastitidis]|uniref:pentapeptide repeat-containing protein n=1 Tax=Corynebacterium mastitidis TaxID=161890 RepID=UPI000363DF4C|nr:pentapeptide repeat-containing protein [Corynebacterium mastitidis]
MKSMGDLPSLENARIANMTFSGKDLPKLIADHSEFRNVTFERCNLMSAGFIDAEFTNVSFLSCDLRKAAFHASNSNECDFRGSDLRGAYLGGKREDYLHQEGVLIDETTRFDYEPSENSVRIFFLPRRTQQ